MGMGLCFRDSDESNIIHPEPTINNNTIIMGLSPFKNCQTGTSLNSPAPNPDPKRWRLLRLNQFKNAFVLKVKYLDCTNFEGNKIMVYRGQVEDMGLIFSDSLDPHFADSDNSPIARFKPDEFGWISANSYAEML